MTNEMARRIIETPSEERAGLFTEAGLELKIDPFYIEKDFWVCWVLGVLFGHEQMGPHLTFRGGTSLSKGWGLIERFSEDVDLAMAREWVAPDLESPATPGLTPSQQNNRLKSLRHSCRKIIEDHLLPVLEEQIAALPEKVKIETPELDRPNDPFVIEVHYPAAGLAVPGDYNRKFVKIELSGKADHWPQEDRTITPYVVEALPQLQGWLPMQIACVKPLRTFWEKAALLHERHTRPGDRALQPFQSRHLYDVVRLWELVQKDIDAGLFVDVMAHRKAFFNCSWVDYETLVPNGLQLVPPDHDRAEWEKDYEAMRPMFRGDPPAFDTLIESIAAIERELGAL